MKYLDYIIQFWKEGEKQCFCASEIALYFFLAKECNRNFWNMPISCSTEYICSQIGLTKQTICNARNSLAKRGLIDITKGRRGKKPPQYSLRDLTNGLTTESTNELTTGLTNDLTNDFTINKDEDKDIDKESGKDAPPEHVEKNVLSISQLKEIVMNDTTWHDKLLVLLSGDGITLDKVTLMELLGQFFLMLETNGPEGKELSDCRQHAYNWIRRNIMNNCYGSKQRDEIRRAVEVRATSSEEYEGPF